MIDLSIINYLILFLTYIAIEVRLFSHDIQMRLTYPVILERTIIFTLLYIITVVVIGQVISTSSTFHLFLKKKKEEKYKKQKNITTPKTRNWIKNSGYAPNVTCSILVLLRDGSIKSVKANDCDWSRTLINADIIEWYPEYAIFSHSGKEWVKNYGYTPPCTGTICLRFSDGSTTRKNISDVEWSDKDIIEWTI